MFFEEYNADLRRYCRTAEKIAGDTEITPEEEIQLFKKFHGQAVLALSADALEARNKIIEHYLELPVAIGIKFARQRDMQKDELISEGNKALITAVHKYDPTGNTRDFRSYASAVIRNALRKYCWERNRTVFIPREEMQLKYALYKAKEKLTAELQRDPTVIELAEECHLTEKHTRQLLLTPIETESYDTLFADPVTDFPWEEDTGRNENDENEIQQMYYDVPEISNDYDKGEKIHFPPSTHVTFHDSLVILRKELKKLNRFQYDVIRYRFNLERFKGNTSFEQSPLSEQDICLMLNCSRSLLNKTKYAALQQLRQEIIARFKEEFDVVRITPRLLHEVLAMEEEQARAGHF